MTGIEPAEDIILEDHNLPRLTSIRFTHSWSGGIRTPMPIKEQIYSLPSQPIAQHLHILCSDVLDSDVGIDC